jgi:hypothetical protein
MLFEREKLMSVFCSDFKTNCQIVFWFSTGPEEQPTRGILVSGNRLARLMSSSAEYAPSAVEADKVRGTYWQQSLIYVGPEEQTDDGVIAVVGMSWNDATI